MNLLFIIWPLILLLFLLLLCLPKQRKDYTVKGLIDNALLLQKLKKENEKIILAKQKKEN